MILIEYSLRTAYDEKIQRKTNNRMKRFLRRCLIYSW